MKKLSKEFKLPKKWKIRQTKKEICDYFNSISTHYYEDISGDYCLHFPKYSFDRHQSEYFEKWKGYTEITFEQFEKYVLKKQTEVIDYSYLKPMLKKLNIK